MIIVNVKHSIQYYHQKLQCAWKQKKHLARTLEYALQYRTAEICLQWRSIGDKGDMNDLYPDETMLILTTLYRVLHRKMWRSAKQSKEVQSFLHGTPMQSLNRNKHIYQPGTLECSYSLN